MSCFLSLSLRLFFETTFPGLLNKNSARTDVACMTSYLGKPLKFLDKAVFHFNNHCLESPPCYLVWCCKLMFQFHQCIRMSCLTNQSSQVQVKCVPWWAFTCLIFMFLVQLCLVPDSFFLLCNNKKLKLSGSAWTKSTQSHSTSSPAFSSPRKPWHPIPQRGRLEFSVVMFRDIKNEMNCKTYEVWGENCACE